MAVVVRQLPVEQFRFYRWLNTFSG